MPAEDHLSAINKKLESVPFIKNLSNKFGIRPALFVVITVAFVFPFLLFGIGGGTLSLVAGALFPAFRTFKVCERIVHQEGKWVFGTISGVAVGNANDSAAIGAETSFLLKYKGI